MSTKKAVFTLCMLAVAYLLLEMTAFVGYYVVYDRFFPFDSEALLRRDMENEAAPVGKNAQASQWLTAQRLTLHPYLGYVRNPDVENYWREWMTPHGFLAERDPFSAGEQPDVAIVAIVGGSVAERFFPVSRHVLRDYLQTLPIFKNKRIDIVMLAVSSWHQPQSLLSVLYYLSQGGKLDMLINLDGKNEATKGYLNYRQGIYPSYPHFYHTFFAGQSNPDYLGYLGEIAMWKNLRFQAAQTLPYLRYSITGSLLWSLFDDYAARRKIEAELALRNREQSKKLPYFMSGPTTKRRFSESELFMDSALIWERSSVQLQKLAQAGGFYYFHFLQPNQYVPDSKPLSDEERRQSYHPSSADALTVAAVYPLMQQKMPALRAQGVAAYDLTALYQQTKETIYIDSCCHVNERGSDVLGHAMGERIAEYFAQSHEPHP